MLRAKRRRGAPHERIKSKPTGLVSPTLCSSLLRGPDLMDTVPNLLPFGLEVNAAGVHAVEQSAEQRAEQRDAQAPLRPEQIISAFAQLADGAQRLSALPQETSLFDVLLTRPEITFEGVTVKLYRRAEVPNDHLHTSSSMRCRACG